MKRLADYEYRIYANKVFVKDLNLGNVSLTNSLENVLEQIQSKESIVGLDIIQIDSDSDLNRITWDGHQGVSWHPVSEEEKINLRFLIDQIF